MNEKIIFIEEGFIDKFYLHRDQKVMLARDLANCYSVKAIRLRERIKRNERILY